MSSHNRTAKWTLSKVEMPTVWREACQACDKALKEHSAENNSTINQPHGAKSSDTYFEISNIYQPFVDFLIDECIGTGYKIYDNRENYGSNYEISFWEITDEKYHYIPDNLQSIGWHAFVNILKSYGIDI